MRHACSRRPPGAWCTRALLGLLVLAIAATALVGSAERARGQEPPVTIAVNVDQPNPNLGDLVTIQIRVEHDADLIVTPRPPRLDGADLVTSPLPVTEALPGGRERTTVDFVVQPFALGQVRISPLFVDWLREDSTSGSAIAAAPVITVVPLRAPGDTELRPLRAQLDVPGAPPAWVRPTAIAGAVATSLLTAIIVAALAWRQYQRGRPLPVPDTTPEEKARAALDTLVGSQLVRPEDFEHYYGTISVTIRRYLEERFSFKATALTTSQLHTRMPGAGIDRWQARLVDGLLVRCDAAVYARRNPDPASADHDLTAAYEIIELSRPREPSPEREAVPA